MSGKSQGILKSYACGNHVSVRGSRLPGIASSYKLALSLFSLIDVSLMERANFLLLVSVSS